MKKILGVALATFGLAAIPTAAQAHVIELTQGNDWARVSADHSQVNVHDKECDGHSVYAEVGSRTGFTVLVWDQNGCDPGGGVGYNVGTGDDIRLCEQTPSGDGCTGWKRID